MGVCGDNFQIRTLFGATAGNTLSVFGINASNDSIAVQGMSGGHAVGITVDSPLDIRALTSTDQVTVAGGTIDAIVSAGITLVGGTLDNVTVFGGVTGYGTGTGPALSTQPGPSNTGLPVLLYGNSGGTAHALGMSGDTLKVSIGQTISADIGSVTVDGSAPQASDFDVTGKLASGSQDGTTVGTPVLLYGMSGGHGVTTTAVALAVTGGGALLTEIQGSINATISSVNVDVPKAVGYTTEGGGTAGSLLLAAGDVTGNTMATPVLLYGASGNTAVALGVTLKGEELGLLVHGDMKVNAPATAPLHITSGANHLAVDVVTAPNLTIGAMPLRALVVRGDTGGITLGGGTLDGINGTVTVSPGSGFSLSGGTLDHVTVFGGVTGYGTGAAPALGSMAGTSTGLPVLLYGNSGGTANAIGMSGDGIKVHHESPLSVSGQVTSVGGVTGMGSSLGMGPGPIGGSGITVSGGLPVLLYGRSGGSQTPVSVGMSADGIKVSVIDGVNIDVSGIDIPSTVSVKNVTDDFLQVGLGTGDTLIPAGSSFGGGGPLTKNTHVFGITGGYHNAFGITAGGTYPSSIAVCGTGGLSTAVQTEDKPLVAHLGGFTNDILTALYPSPTDAAAFDPANPGTNMNDRLNQVLEFLDGSNTLPVSLASGFATSTQFGAVFGIGGVDGGEVSLITHAAQEDSTGVIGSGDLKNSLNVDVQSIRLPDGAAGDGGDPLNGNTAGVLPSSIADTEEVAVQLPNHNLTKGVSIKNTSGTGIVHVGFGVASQINTASATSTASYQLLSREEVFLETQNLNNIWVASCPGASGCYIGG